MLGKMDWYRSKLLKDFVLARKENMLKKRMPLLRVKEDNWVTAEKRLEIKYKTRTKRKITSKNKNKKRKRRETVT